VSGRDELLAQLDESAQLFMYPGLPNEYFALADMRLTAFRSDDEWLVVFETVGWSIRETGFDDLVFAFGNEVAKPGLQTAVPVVTGPGGESPWADDGEFRLDLHDLHVVVRGEEHELQPTDGDLQNAQVDDESMPEPARVIRLLAAKLPGALFLPDDELLEICGRAGLERLLQVDDWRQPDLIEDEQPSDIGCLRSLGDAVEAGDASRYECPEGQHNTHWTNWED
jgi:hypothetical protein